MSEWRNGAALDQMDVRRAGQPAGIALPRKFGPPAELARCRREPVLDGVAQPCFGADAGKDDKLAARLQHAREFVERCFWIGHGRNDVLRNHDIERIVRKRQPLRIHDFERLNMVQAKLRHALARLRQHRLGNVDADDPVGRRIIRQRNPRPYSDFENASADTLRSNERSTAPTLEHRAKDEVVNRCPAIIGLRNRCLLDVFPFRHEFPLYGSR